MSDDDSSSEDLDYKPTTKEIKEAEGEEQRSKRLKVGHGDDFDLPKSAKESAKVEDLWQQMMAGTCTKPKLNMAALSRPAHKSKVPAADREWMRQLGFQLNSVEPAKEKKEVSSSELRTTKDETSSGITRLLPHKEAKVVLDTSVAASALAAAKAAMSSTEAQTAGRVPVLETRRFAGKDVQVTTLATSEEAARLEQKERERKKAGLDAVLASLEGTKKVNVLDKSRDDWGTFKSGNTHIAEELEAYKKSGGKYLDKVDFLKRAELREYEAERDKRLAGDIRSRGRS